MTARILSIVFLLLTLSAYSQRYELYAGSVISEDIDMQPGYMIGLNTVFDMKQNREYLDKLLVGFEHSAFMSPIIHNVSIIDNNNISQNVSCNCESDNIDFNQSSQYRLKKEVRAVSLNLGLEFCSDCWLKNLYLLTGVTNYQHITKIDNQKVSEYRTMQIDAGFKYYIKINNNYLSPIFKFNPETISFGIGFAR